MYPGMTASSCTTVIDICICRILLFYLYNWDFRHKVINCKAFQKWFWGASPWPCVSIELLQHLRGVKERGAGINVLCFSFSSMYWGAKIDHECECLISCVFDFKKNPRDWLAHICTWGSMYETNLWIIVGVTDMKLDQLQYCWHWLRGVKWGMEKTIFDQD